MATPALPIDAAVETFVSNGDVEIATYSHGDPSAPTVLLVHGWPDSHRLWDGVVPLLADDFHVVTYDMRGAGRSSNPKSRRRFTMTELVTDLTAVADAVSPDYPVHVIGHDWGSIHTWEAVCQPGAEHRFASFTSISGPSLDHSGRWMRSLLTRPTRHSLRTALAQARSSWYLILFQIPVLPNAVVRGVASRKRWTRFLERVEGTPTESIHVGETLAQDMRNGIQLYRANMIPRMVRPNQRSTRVPVQLIVNTQDMAILPENYGDYAAWTEHLRRRDVDAGHWLPHSQPDLIAETAREFITDVEAKRI